MRLMFVYYLLDDGGSGQDLRNYTQVAKELGYEVILYGPTRAGSALHYSLDVDSADVVIFVFEWTTQLRDGDHLDLARLVGRVPRQKRIVIDCDGAYNDPIAVNDDYNHRNAAASRRWTEVCDSLADKICQPTFRPLRPNVHPFLFHAYNPSWETPLDFSRKEYGMIYVGHSKFRWWPMYRMLRAIEPIREQFGRIGLVGHGWDALPSWAVPMRIEDAYYTDQAYLKKLDVEFIQPIPFDQVIGWMSKGVLSPVIYRPLFEELGLVTCRTFETPAAGTIPLFGLETGYVKEIYGEHAAELVLPKDHPEEKILDIVDRPQYYAEIVKGIRHYLAQKHSYKARLQELVKLVES